VKELSQEVVSVTTFSCPLLTYLSTSPCPTPAHIQLLCSQHGSGGVTSSGQGPLHLLLNNNNTSVNQQQLHSLLPDLVTSLLQAGVRLDQRDEEGNTALLALTHLLEKREWSLAAHIATLFCTRSDCDVNSVNLQGRSLLSISVSYLDDSIELTRVLINAGARVWPDDRLSAPESVEEIQRDSETSAFTWFLRSVINQRGLENSEATLECLCHEMGRSAERMKSHVVRVMLSEGRHPRVLGPVFLKLKMIMAPFWTQPQHLTYLAWNSVRRSLGPKRLGRASNKTSGQGLKLPLPQPMINYLTLASSSGTKPHHSVRAAKLN